MFINYYSPGVLFNTSPYHTNVHLSTIAVAINLHDKLQIWQREFSFLHRTGPLPQDNQITKKKYTVMIIHRLMIH